MTARSSLLLLALATACAARPVGSTGDVAGTITGTIDYAGPERGPLRVAAFTAFPPTGAPLAETSIEDPVFPQRYTLRGLPSGRYFVLAIVDTNPADGDRYRPRVDPGGTFGRYDSPASVTVGAAAPVVGVDVELAAPSAHSPWDR